MLQSEEALQDGERGPTVLDQEKVECGCPRRCASVFAGDSVKQISGREAKGLEAGDVQTSSSQQAAS